jgi:diguanylate cyclase (GGDEF)-like protein/PAS domain S-box-containing protein
MNTPKHSEKPLQPPIAEQEKIERGLEEQTFELINASEQRKREILEWKRKEEHLGQIKQAVEMMQLGVMISDLDGKIIYTNHAEAAMHGYQGKELLGQDVSMLTPPELRRSLTLNEIKAWKGLIREGFNLRKDGTIFPVWLMSEIVQNPEGEPYAIVTSCEDITERKQAEEELRKYRNHLEHMVADRTAKLTATNEHLRREITRHKRTAEALRKSEEKQRIVLETIPDPVVVYNMEGKVIYLNPAFSRVFGWTLSESRDRGIDFVPVENFFEAALIFEKIKHGKTVSNNETYRLTKDGSRVEVNLSGAGFFDNSGKLQGSVITIQDITERKKTEEEIQFIAYHDALTGLPNRKSFYMRLENELAQSYSQDREKRRVTDRKWALLFLDLDRFKYVNDTLGHDVGDELLKFVASRLQICLRKNDYIYRLGSDEFMIVLNALTNDTDVAKVAEKIREEIAQPYYIENHELYVTVSIGISVYPSDGNDAEGLVKNADMAMYVAKEEGQGYRFFTEEMNSKALERMRLESNLRNALQHNQFVVYYQPLADDHNRIVGMEALLRWYHPELGVISPSQFIPLAEETGIIVPIGKWVLYRACEQARKWCDMGYVGFCLAVNLSARQFREPDLIETVEQVLADTGLAPNYLKLEVTESGVMEYPEQAIETMKTLRAKGLHFAIDDFGTGYSSLAYLKRLPIDTLKIDRSFVMDSVTNKDDQEIIKTIIAMARNLSMNTVAEGVETKEQQEFLTQHGCRMMQGYYFGKPMPAMQFEELLYHCHNLC